MAKSLQRFFLLLILIAVQALVLNHVHIMGYATPSLFIYYILTANSETSRNSLLLQAFFLGLCMDIFSNTPGLNAAAATLMAFARTPLLRMQTSGRITGEFNPCIRTLGFSHFVHYALGETVLFVLTLQALNLFSLHHGTDFILRVLSDSLMTVLLIVCVDALRRSK